MGGGWDCFIKTCHVKPCILSLIDKQATQKQLCRIQPDSFSCILAFDKYNNNVSLCYLIHSFILECHKYIVLSEMCSSL